MGDKGDITPKSSHKLQGIDGILHREVMKCIASEIFKTIQDPIASAQECDKLLIQYSVVGYAQLTQLLDKQSLSQWIEELLIDGKNPQEILRYLYIIKHSIILAGSAKSEIEVERYNRIFIGSLGKLKEMKNLS